MLPYSWIIAVLPLLSFLMIVFFLNKNNKVSSYFSITMVLTSFLLSCVVLVQVLNDPTPKEYWVEWLEFGDSGPTGTMPMGDDFQIDHLEAIEEDHIVVDTTAIEENHNDITDESDKDRYCRYSEVKIPRH